MDSTSNIFKTFRRKTLHLNWACAGFFSSLVFHQNTIKVLPYKIYIVLGLESRSYLAHMGRMCMAYMEIKFTTSIEFGQASNYQRSSLIYREKWKSCKHTVHYIVTVMSPTPRIVMHAPTDYSYHSYNSLQGLCLLKCAKKKRLVNCLHSPQCSERIP